MLVGRHPATDANVLHDNDQSQSVNNYMYFTMAGNTFTVRSRPTANSVTDVYKHFQKLIHGDQITIFDLQSLYDHCMSELGKLLERPLPGGYEEKIETCDGTAKGDTLERFSDVSLSHTQTRKAKRRHLFVTTRSRNFGALKLEIVNSLRNFL